MDGRVCKGCNTWKCIQDLVKKADCKGGVRAFCLTCKNAKQVISRTQDKNKSTKKYEKTLRGYTVRTYRNMKSRVTGIVKNKAHLYHGLEILDKEAFYAFCEASNLEELLKDYEESGYDLKLAPSIDRKDSSRGYSEDNIQWITFSENSRKGALSKMRKKTND